MFYGFNIFFKRYVFTINGCLHKGHDSILNVDGFPRETVFVHV